jgi:hypothetical protein
MTDRSAGCALLHECGKCGGCITRGVCAACNAQRIGQLWMSITERLWLWQLNKRWQRKWKPCSNGGAQCSNAGAEQRCE